METNNLRSISSIYFGADCVNCFHHWLRVKYNPNNYLSFRRRGSTKYDNKHCMPTLAFRMVLFKTSDQERHLEWGIPGSVSAHRMFICCFFHFHPKDMTKTTMNKNRYITNKYIGTIKRLLDYTMSFTRSLAPCKRRGRFVPRCITSYQKGVERILTNKIPGQDTMDGAAKRKNSGPLLSPRKLSFYTICFKWRLNIVSIAWNLSYCNHSLIDAYNIMCRHKSYE